MKREVYADWLESKGAVLCAEYVRLVVEPLSPDTRHRLTSLNVRTARTFRASVAVGNIEQCNRRRECPARWEKLPFTEGTSRRCQVCKVTVSFLDELRPNSLGPQVVVDPALDRRPGDLLPHVSPIEGRPLIVDGLPRTATSLGGDRHLDPKLIEALTSAALNEHASIATFARTLCELMALGAPHELLVETQRALGDEVRHAEMTFEQIERLGGGVRRAGPLPEATAPLRRSVAEFREDVRQGAAGEEESVRAAHERAAATNDPELRAFYLVIAEDEARHAALAHKTIRWLDER